MSADFFAGYLSGAVGILVGNPLDIIKVRLQASPSASTNTYPPTNQGYYKQHFQTAGALLKGLPAPVLTYGALNALLFISYNRSLSYLDPSWSPNTSTGINEPQSAPSALNLWTAGAIAGFATWIVSAPTELIKCRAQVAASSTTHASAPTQPAPSSWSIAKQIYTIHGPRGLYFGGGITSLRDAIGYGFYFWAYEASTRAWKASIASPAPDTTATAETSFPHWLAANQNARILLCGGLAGIATWISIFPLDVIKTRMQTQAAFLPLPATQRPMSPTAAAFAAPAVPTARAAHEAAERRPLLAFNGRDMPEGTVRGAFTLARQAYAAEGVGVFWRGVTVCCVRAFVVNAVQWGVYEWVMGSLRQEE